MAAHPEALGPASGFDLFVQGGPTKCLNTIDYHDEYFLANGQHTVPVRSATPTGGGWTIIAWDHQLEFKLWYLWIRVLPAARVVGILQCCIDRGVLPSSCRFH